MGACPTRNGRIRIRLCCHKFRVAFVEAFSGGATSGPSGTHQNGFYSVYIYKTLREWAISSIPDARIKLVCWPPRLPSTQKGAQRSNLIYDRRGEAPTFDLSRRWRRRNHRLRERSRTQAALLLIDYQFFEDEGDCYCNPFRCVCGSATGVPQSSRRWRGGVLCVVDAQVQVLRLLDVRMPPRVGHLLWKARRRRALLLRLLLVPMLPLGYG